MSITIDALAYQVADKLEDKDIATNRVAIKWIVEDYLVEKLGVDNRDAEIIAVPDRKMKEEFIDALFKKIGFDDRLRKARYIKLNEIAEWVANELRKRNLISVRQVNLTRVLIRHCLTDKLDGNEELNNTLN